MIPSSAAPASPTPPAGVALTSDPAFIPILDDVRTPLRRLRDGVQLVLLAQPTMGGLETIVSIPDALGINGETQIGLSRARRILPAGRTDAPMVPARETCSLCGGAPRRDGAGVISADNPRPFGPLVHAVVFTARHIESVDELEFEHVLDATEMFHELARRQHAEQGELFDGLTIGMNFGEYAKSGASQPHVHYQVAGLGRANYNAGDRLGMLCRAYRREHSGADYLADYTRALQHTGLVIVENDDALAFAPISPRFKGEVQIMLRRSTAGNILDTTAAERRALASLQFDVLQRLSRLGCAALNQVWYATRLSAVNDYGQRLIMCVYPRSAILAFYELSGNHVIDTEPWESARIFRETNPHRRTR